MAQEAPVALGIKTPNTMQTLGNIMETGNQMLAFKRAQATLPYAAPMAQAQTQRAQIEAQGAKFGLSLKQLQAGAAIVGAGLKDARITSGNPLQALDAINGMREEMQKADIPAAQASVLINPLVTAAAHNPQALPNLMGTIARSVMEPGAQMAASTPSGPVLDNGQEKIPTNTNPYAGPIGAIPGETTQIVPSPTTPVIGPHGVPGLLGAQPTVGAQPIGTPPLGEAPQVPGATPIGYAPGIVPMATGVAHAASEDYQHVVANANIASRGIGVLANIQSAVKSGALTGVGAEQRAFVTGIAGVLGLNNDDLTNAQVIAKQVSLLTGMNPAGATDMGRQIALMSTPHNGMTASALNQVGDELRAQFQMNLKEQQILQHVQMNPGQYMHARALINEANNPMVLLYANGNAATRARIMKGYSTPQQQKTFEDQLNAASALGIIGPPGGPAQ